MIESPLLPHFQGYIAGEWTGADSGKTLAVTNPATGEQLAEVASMGPEETRRAVQAGSAALERPASLEQRARWLTSVSEALRENREEVGRILTLEHGKPWKEAQGEVEYAAGFFRFCSENIEHLGPRTLSERPKDATWTVHQRPAGVVALITPWNFPIAMIAKKLCSAMAADCSSVIKPSSKTPLTMIALFTLLDRELDLPPGKVNLVMGSAGPITQALFDAEAVRVVSFTGSTEVGRKLIEQAAPGIKRTTLELGGNAPFIVFDDADLDKAADHLVANKFRGAGQTCVCANRVYVQRAVAEAYAEKVGEKVRNMRVGDGMAEGTDIGPLIDEKAVEKVQRHVDDAVSKGAREVASASASVTGKAGTFFPPTVLMDVPADAVLTHDETFGPLVSMIAFDDDEEVINASNDVDHGLAAYVFTRDQDRGMRAVERLRFGHVGLNTGTGPTPEAPFGGMKQSGYGREGGIEGLFEFVETQTVPNGS